MAFEGLLKCLDPAPACAPKVEDVKKWHLQVPLIPESDPAGLCCLADPVGLVNGFLYCIV